MLKPLLKTMVSQLRRDKYLTTNFKDKSYPFSSPLACPACHREGFSSALPAPCSGMSNVRLQQYACMCAQPERVWSLSPFTITIK